MLDQRRRAGYADRRRGAAGRPRGFHHPSRIVHLPLSWRDPATIETIEKYMGAVRDDAPWCPDNIEFIRRINGLPDVAAVENLIFDANYLVLGLGDVYLGAPVATPIDPRHRLVTTKYNPGAHLDAAQRRGIGGAYMCIYGMEGPGGYQLFGRTIQVWNTHRQTDAFVDGKPWLLRFFDQIRFYPVSAEELVEWRRDFPERPALDPDRGVGVPPRRLSRLPGRECRGRSRTSRHSASRLRRGAREWQRRGEFDRVTDLAEEPAPEAVASRCPRAPIWSRRPSAAASGSCWSRRATT
jgi:urea carboxylase